MFAHGFNIRFGTITPPANVDVSMIAPKAPDIVSAKYSSKAEAHPGCSRIHQDAAGKAKQLALSYGKAIRATRAGVIETTFAEETETDLFGGQTVLCGGVSALLKAGLRLWSKLLPARDRLLRISARAEAHRGPYLSRWS